MLRKLGDEAAGDMIRLGDPIPLRRLAQDSAGFLRPTWPRAWPAWLAVLAADALAHAGMATFHEPTRSLSSWPEAILTIAQVALTALPWAFGLRLALGADRPLALDAGLGAFVGLNVLAAAALDGWGLFTDAVEPKLYAALSAYADPGRAAGLGVVDAVSWGSLVIMTAMILVFTMLSLWPLGLLMRVKGASPQGSWRDMRGALLPVLAITAVVIVACSVLLWIFKRSLPPQALGAPDSLLDSFVWSLAFYPGDLVVTAVFAAIWVIRSGDAARRIAAFD